MAERDALIEGFLARCGWADAERRPLAGDASFRRYERLSRGSERAVLMDAPPPRENVRPFVAIARHLSGLGYSAPAIYGEDMDAGLLLLEDLGDATFARALAGGASKATLYGAAVDVLADLHAKPENQAIPTGLADYDTARLLTEAELFTDWYMPKLFGRPTDPAIKTTYAKVWQALSPVTHSAGRTLVLRDFFADNLMWLPERGGVRAVGLLDFQDALAGSPAYDLMSLLEDERRDIDPALEADLFVRYLVARPRLNEDSFRAAYAVLSAQRHCKNIGIFTRLCVRDGKSGYLVHIPRMWRMLERTCRDPLLKPLADWLDRNVPAEHRRAPHLESVS